MGNLRKYQESLNIFQAILAKAAGCTQGAIGYWEFGRRFPDLKTYRALVVCLNKLGAKVSLDDVFPPEHKAAQQVDPLFVATDIRLASLKSEFQDI